MILEVFLEDMAAGEDGRTRPRRGNVGRSRGLREPSGLGSARVSRFGASYAWPSRITRARLVSGRHAVSSAAAKGRPRQHGDKHADASNLGDVVGRVPSSNHNQPPCIFSVPVNDCRPALTLHLYP